MMKAEGRIKKLEFHPIANLFPLLEGPQFEALRRDIAEQGLLEPIVLFEGKILDGRNRYRACLANGQTPKFDTRQFGENGVEAIRFGIGKNALRRHLSDAQRGAAAAEADALIKAVRAGGKHRQKIGASRGGKRNSVQVKVPEHVPEAGDARDELGRAFGISGRSVDRAIKIRTAAPDLHRKLKSDEISLHQATKILNDRQKREEMAAASKRAGKRKGDQWEVRCGDCLELLGKLKESPRLIFADPPYNLGVDYGNGKQADRLPEGEYLRWCRAWIVACAEALTVDGSLWLLISDEWAAPFAIILRRAKLHRRAWVKWYETFGVNCENNFNRCSRHLFYCVADPKRFTFNQDAVRRPSDRQTKYHDQRAHPEGKLWDDVWQIPRLTGTCAERLPDVPTQLPLALVRPIVGACSMPGDLVVDPFCGSGTTGAAALELGRRFLGIELSKTYCELAKQRLQRPS